MLLVGTEGAVPFAAIGMFDCCGADCDSAGVVASVLTSGFVAAGVPFGWLADSIEIILVSIIDYSKEDIPVAATGTTAAGLKALATSQTSETAF